MRANARATISRLRSRSAGTLAWLLVFALPLVMAACNKSGGSGY